ncbi:MAG: alpha/beta hydrolase [Saccharothrix sp.]|nr:alpha/beta hydrolase [Saccharothrix sp.]
MISRRSFAKAVTAGVVATSLPAAAAPVARAGGATSLGVIKHVEAGVLDIAYAEFGPRDGQAVVLLHGWPYDAHSYVDVAPALAAEGYRVIVPFLRGYGGTTFRSARTFRNAQQSAVALDVIALMDALRIERAVLGGFDWGARTAAVVAALWPRRCKALVSVSGYLVTNLAKNQEPLAPAAELNWWYQYYFATERGVLGYRRNRHAFNELIWRSASPRWDFDEATYARTAASFENPDHVDIVIHNYRWRLGLAPGEPRYDHYERQLAAAPAITVPTITIGSDFDGASADGSSYRDKFTGRYDHRVFAGIGHNVPQEAPQDFARAIVDADHL